MKLRFTETFNFSSAPRLAVYIQTHWESCNGWYWGSLMGMN